MSEDNKGSDDPLIQKLILQPKDCVKIHGPKIRKRPLMYKDGEQNAYFCPNFIPNIQKYFLPQAALWSGLLLGNLERHGRGPFYAKVSKRFERLAQKSNQNYTTDNKTQGIMEKSQWDLKKIRFQHKRLTRLDDFVHTYTLVHDALLREYQENKEQGYDIRPVTQSVRVAWRHLQSIARSCDITGRTCEWVCGNVRSVENQSQVGQTSSEPSELSIYSCQLCACPQLANERDYFSHVNEYLRRNETVTCMFKDCSFKTSIYNTFNSHKNRKHNPHTVNDFKAEVVSVVARLQESDTSVIDVSCAAGTDVESETDVDAHASSIEDVPKAIEQNIASVLLKLEHVHFVPATSVKLCICSSHIQ
ncbi:hypothetical protein JOB18_039481 [Solea senegalensis]|uniref:C2H2-type domain-containing protein n=1 Tax=Solea senegalensis TaxID=28829 RepID=A0AAV6PFJ3_SOLSE|nr:hypothetical protein JOB18_039481 [Solea senegalensis]